MNFNKFENNSYCVGGRHRSNTVKIYSDITSKGGEVLIGFCSVCNRNISMLFSDSTMKAEGIFGNDFC